MKAREVAEKMALREFIRMTSLIDETTYAGQKFEVVRVKRENDDLEVLLMMEDRKFLTLKVA